MNTDLRSRSPAGPLQRRDPLQKTELGAAALIRAEPGPLAEAVKKARGASAEERRSLRHVAWKTKKRPSSSRRYVFSLKTGFDFV